MTKGVPIALYEVRRGDVVMAEAGRACKVKELPRGVHTGEGCTEYELPGIVTGSQNRIINLIHRPWPEGRNELSMLAGITVAAHHLVQCSSFFPKEVQDAIVELREAIEAYELGKPFDKAQGEPLEPEKE